jgi:hypothetical protein
MSAGLALPPGFHIRKAEKKSHPQHCGKTKNILGLFSAAVILIKRKISVH